MKKQIVCLLVSVTMLFSIFPSFSLAAELEKNSAGNIENGGFITEYKGWYYYRDFNWDGEDGTTLYKVRTNGRDKQLLAKDLMHVSNLLISDDHLYFSNRGTSGPADGTGIFRMNLKTKQMQLIAEHAGTKFYIVDNKIYYAASKGVERWDGEYVTSMNRDGSQKKRLVAKAVDAFTTDRANIYYTQNGTLYQTSMKGAGKKKITANQASGATVQNNWVYYINENKNNQLYKVRIDGKYNTKLTSGAVATYHVNGTSILYSYDNKKTAKGSPLYEMDLNGKQQKKITDKSISTGLFRLKDKILYNVFNEKDATYHFYLRNYKNGKLGYENMMFKVFYP
ncbi:MAG: DUF5050 domain-containing protein [Bacillus sp. (in: firmicutes)]